MYIYVYIYVTSLLVSSNNIYIYIYIYIFSDLCKQFNVLKLMGCIYKCIYIYTCLYINMYIFTYLYINMYIYTYLYIYMYIYTYLYIYINGISLHCLWKTRMIKFTEKYTIDSKIYKFKSWHWFSKCWKDLKISKRLFNILTPFQHYWKPGEHSKSITTVDPIALNFATQLQLEGKYKSDGMHPEIMII
jgi:hypothetical protein